MIYHLNNIQTTQKLPIRQIVICGAGVAGIILALKLAQKRIGVTLIEGGDEFATQQSQEIYNGRNTAMKNEGINACRLRYLGGTSNHWAGRCMRLQPIDFTDREFFELPGWPIAPSELDKHFEEACDILDVSTNEFDPPAFPGQFISNSLKTIGHADSPPTRFARKYHKLLANSRYIDVYLNANLTAIYLNDAGNRVKSIMVSDYNNQKHFLTGKEFVLAMGAIENARFLLNSNKQIPKGIGNHSDFVGRCFMEHLNVPLGRFITDYDNELWNVKQFELFPKKDFALKQKIGTGVIAFHPHANPPTYGHLASMKRYIRNSICTSTNLTELSRHLVDFDCPGDGIIDTLIEQTPNRNTRITLDRETDRFGVHRICLNWEINDLDLRTIRTLALEAAKELARNDLARVQLPSYILEQDEDIPVGEHCHHMGTTRMASQRKNGVVDTNCMVFGIDNLYIAGSSVFPTGGGVNPTFTIVQLTLRLAEHLSAKSFS